MKFKCISSKTTNILAKFKQEGSMEANMLRLCLEKLK
jgi:hypothetical protein